MGRVGRMGEVNLQEEVEASWINCVPLFAGMVSEAIGAPRFGQEAHQAFFFSCSPEVEIDEMV
jgi:hypothetical protein